ncbi:MAG: DeoR/GlpR transcriptional regulator, partial [Clostridia bacterium]|nr:DeoR/GlpR transcriptional regulator [Clostridia bacterium]
NQKSVTVSKLSKEFNVTEETIRKDLQLLENEGILKRIYGGAYVEESVQGDVDVNLRENILVKDKEIIAEKCVPFVKDGDSIFLDASTTSYYIASKIMSHNITLITNSLKIASLVANSDTVKLLLIGGIYDKRSMSFLGKNAENDIQKYFVDKAFVSCRSVHLDFGITDSNEQQAEIRKIAFKHSHQTFLVVDHTKFNKTSFSFIADLSDIDEIVTNQPLSEAWVDRLKQEGINITAP